MVIIPRPIDPSLIDGDFVPEYRGKTIEFVINKINLLTEQGLNAFHPNLLHIKKYSNSSSTNYLFYNNIKTVYLH